jgi:hypothetical protein
MPTIFTDGNAGIAALVN